MPRKYQINQLIWFVKDESSVRFHIDQDDYFGSIATILSLVRQKIKITPPTYLPECEKVLNNLEKDLSWLQKHYQITPKIKKKNRTPKGKENNQ